MIPFFKQTHKKQAGILALLILAVIALIVIVFMFDAEIEEHLLLALTGAASRPWLVYSIVFVAMYASSFGLPVPEEVTLLTVGFIAYMARNPELYPGTPLAGEGIRLTTAAMVCLFAVMSSSTLWADSGGQAC